ncbi:MAG: SemiSWEET transporter [Nanoarchaeota archaeon]|nr:SemiSWEET transporter [Nanoarchaeota archaeon]
MEFITLIGFAGASLTTFAPIPQLIKIIQMKETKDLSLPMYLMVSLGVLLWLVYGILTSDIVLIIANAVSIIFNMAIVVLKLKYK